MTTETPKFDFAPGKLYRTRTGRIVQYAFHLKGGKGSSRLTEMFVYRSSGQHYWTDSNGRYEGHSYSSGYDIVEEIDLQYLVVDRDPDTNKLTLTLYDTKEEAEANRTKHTVSLSERTAEDFIK